MSYLNCLPSPVRDSLLGLVTYKGSWSSGRSIELVLFNPNEMPNPDSCVRLVIHGGGLRLVKEFYKKYITPISSNPGSGYEMMDLVWTIRYGHLKIFWYLFHLFRVRKRKDTMERICNWVLRPMIEMSRGEWIASYFWLYPDDPTIWGQGVGDDLFALAFVLRDTRAIYELLHAGFKIGESAVRMAYLRTEDKVLSVMGNMNDVYLEHRAMEKDLYHFVRLMGKRYPRRVSKKAIAFLLPRIPELDDES